MRRLHQALTLVILLPALLFSVWRPPLLTDVTGICFDLYQRLTPRCPQGSFVRVVDVDEESLRRHGQWPWPRDLLARLVTRLTALGATVVAFDMVFPEADRTSPRQLLAYLPPDPVVSERLAALPDHDELLATAMKQGRVVTGFSVSSRDEARMLPTAKARIITVGDSPAPSLFPFAGAVVNLPMLERAALGNGAFNILASHDGVIRRVPLLLRVGQGLYPALATEALRVSLGEKNIVVRTAADQGAHGTGATGISQIGVGRFAINTDSSGSVWLHYAPSRPEQFIPAWRLLADRVAMEELQGRMVLVGTSAKGLMDLRVTPLGGVMPGVEIHAQLLEQLLQGSYLRTPSWEPMAQIVLLALTGILAMAVAFRLPPAPLAAVALSTLGAIGYGSWWAFARHRLLLDPVLPGTVLMLLFALGGSLRQIHTEQERRWIRNAFSRYISPNLVTHLIRHPQELVLGGERRECSFVLTDLSGFTAFVERMKPQAVVKLLNAYIEGMIDIAFRHDATLDRIVGDGIALIFSAPVVQEDHGPRALASALAMDAFARRFAEEYRSRGIPLGGTRIGVHTGTVLVGNFGGKTMMDYRALGDPINTCSRLETVNRHLGTRICVSGVTRARCPEFVGRPVGRLLLKGKSEAIEAFEPLPAASMASERVRSYLAAYSLLEAKAPEATTAFAALCAAHPEDGLAAFHLQRLQAGESGSVIIMSEK